MRFFLFILVAAGLVAGGMLVRDKRAEQRTQGWALQVMPVIQPLLDGTLNSAAPHLPDEAAFYKLLLLLHTIEEKELDLRTILAAACSKLGYLGEKADLIQESLMQNYETAKRFQMFDEPSQLVSLERGEPVPIQLSGWDGEMSAVGQIVPPEKAPEVANCLPNLVLLPSIARNAQDGTISAQTQDHARNLSRCGFLDRLTLDAILQTSRSRTIK